MPINSIEKLATIPTNKCQAKNISLADQRGIIMPEFLFAFIVSLLLCCLVFMFAYSFVTTEVVQYMAFSVARAAASADQSPEDQETAANRKFERLQKAPVWSYIFQGEWFTVSKPEVKIAKTPSDFFNSYGNPNPEKDNRIPDTGVRIPVTINLLSKDFPMLGSTYLEDPDEFSTFVTGFVFREPSSSECMEKNVKLRMTGGITDLDPRFTNGATQFNNATAAQGYVPLEDNGC